MLLATIQTIFRSSYRPEEKTQLYLDRREPSHWPDGTDHSAAWRSQPPYVKAKDGCYVLAHDRAYHGAVQMRFDGPPCSAEEAAKRCCSQMEKSTPSRRWVITLRPEAYNESDLKAKDKVRCRNYKDAVAKILVFLRQDDNVSLDEIRNPHAGGDGSFGLAYRMECGWDDIYISVTWAYYGK